jgi:transposase
VGRWRPIGRIKCDLDSELYVRVDAKSRPIRMFLSAGQTLDYVGARTLLHSIQSATALIGRHGYYAGWFSDDLVNIGRLPCITLRRCRKGDIPHYSDLCHQRHNIENMFARLKDRRRISIRYDRCLIFILSACALVATVIYL